MTLAAPPKRGGFPLSGLLVSGGHRGRGPPAERVESCGFGEIRAQEPLGSGPVPTIPAGWSLAAQ
jgi:hypothetical protein